MTEPKRTSFEIYHKKEGFYWTTDRIVYSIIIPCIVLFFIKNHFWGSEGDLFDKIVSFSMIGAFFYGTVMKLSGFVRHQPLKGKLEGTLILEMDKISIDNQVYNLDEIKKIEISNGDYRGQFLYTSKGSFEANLSQGVNNKIYITLNSGEIISCAFLQFNRYDMADAKKQLINYHLKEKIHFLHLIDILGITDYNQIQLFKKEIQWFQEDELKS